MKAETRDPKPETRNLKAETGNPILELKPETRNTKQETCYFALGGGAGGKVPRGCIAFFRKLHLIQSQISVDPIYKHVDGQDRVSRLRFRVLHCAVYDPELRSTLQCMTLKAL